MPSLPSFQAPQPGDMRRWLSRVLIWSLVLLAGYIFWQIAAQVMIGADIGASIGQEQTAIAGLESEQRNLEGLAEYNRSDAAVERIAREQLDMVYPQDVVLDVVTQVPTATPVMTPTEALLPTPTLTPADPNWRSWVDLVLDRD